MNYFILAVIFLLGTLTILMSPLEGDDYRYFADNQDMLFATSGWFGFYLKYSGFKTNSRTNFLLLGLLFICFGGVIANLTDTNYVYKPWGIAMPAICGLIFIVGLIREWRGH